jgi:hypothetical protein
VSVTSRENVSASLPRQCGGSLWRKTFLMTHSSAYLLLICTSGSGAHTCVYRRRPWI